MSSICDFPYSVSGYTTPPFWLYNRSKSVFQFSNTAGVYKLSTALLPTAVMQNKQSLLNILLYGSDNFPEDTNFNIFSFLQAYISSSKRFST